MTGQHGESREPLRERVWRAVRPVVLPVRRFRRRIGRRGCALLVFAAIDYIIGSSFLDPELRAQTGAVPVYRALLDVAPLTVWGWLWLTVAVACTVQAVMRNDSVAYALAIGIKAVWAGGMLVSWVFFDAARGWLSASLWGVIAALVVVINGWPEPGTDHVPSDDGPL